MVDVFSNDIIYVCNVIKIIGKLWIVKNDYLNNIKW